MAILASSQITITDLLDAHQLSLTSDTIVIRTLADGSGGIFDTTTSSTVSVNLGGADDTSNWSISTTLTNVTGTFAANKFTVQTLSADAGSIVFTATRSGFSTLTKTVNVIKAKQGAVGSGSYFSLSDSPDEELFSLSKNASGSKGTSVNGPQSTYTRRNLEGKFGGSCIAVEEASTNLYGDGDFSSGAVHQYQSGPPTIVDDNRAMSGKKVLKFSPGANQYNGRSINVLGTGSGNPVSANVWCYVSSDYDSATAPALKTSLNGTDGSAAYDLTKKGTWQNLKRENFFCTGTATTRVDQDVTGTFTRGFVLFDNVQVENKKFSTSFIMPSSTTTPVTQAAGLSTLQVVSSKGFYSGQSLIIDLGASQELGIVNSIPDSTHITLSSPTTKEHFVGTIISSLTGSRPAGQLVYTDYEASVNFDKWSFLAWIKRENTTVIYNMIIGMWPKFYFGFNPIDALQCSWTSPGGQVDKPSSLAVSDNQWHLVGFSIDKAAGTITYFKDGAADVQTGVTFDLSGTTGAFTIGQRTADNTTYPGNFLIDNMAVFKNSLLTVEKVNQIWTINKPFLDLNAINKIPSPSGLAMQVVDYADAGYVYDGYTFIG